MKRIAALLLLLLAACASHQPPLVAPAWDAVPAGITDFLCNRLKGDHFAEELVIVKITQPLADANALRALFPMRNRPYEVTVPPTRAIPVELGSACNWTAIDAAQRNHHHDSVLVELSAPLLNPADPGAAGLFARVSTGGASEWYWIGLRPQGQTWALAGIAPVSVH
ncbi:MAG TPA: hypothetical protein VHW00_25910 [Thermoanaerobaculia bacterium]|nr:hypothetical protein [Thermoanaerobaculia bacterium]